MARDLSIWEKMLVTLSRNRRRCINSALAFAGLWRNNVYVAMRRNRGDSEEERLLRLQSIIEEPESFA